MKRITKDRLASACEYQIEIFNREWPNGAPVTIKEAMKAIMLNLDLDWLIKNILPASLRSEYQRQEASLRSEYQRQEASLRDKYWWQEEPLRSEYQRQEASLWSEYQRQKARLIVKLVKQV